MKHPVQDALGLLVLLGLACGGNDSRPTWRTVLGTLEGSGHAVYSWRFYGADGPARFTVGIHAQGQNEACRSYSLLGEDQGSDYWFLALDFGDSRAGTYQVVPIRGTAAGPGSVEVALLHRYRGSYVENYVAVSGEIAVATAPTFSDFRAGVPLVLSGWISWPAQPKQQLKCAGSFSQDQDAAAQLECSCKDPSGNLSTCEPSAVGENCCVLGDIGSVVVEIPKTEASPCAGMCRFLVGLSDPCSANLGTL
jgi:hypothetical protein